MLRIAPMVLMTSMAFGSAFIAGCDKEKSSTETKTVNPDGSSSKSEKSDSVSSNGTVTHVEKSVDKAADSATTKP